MFLLLALANAAPLRDEPLLYDASSEVFVLGADVAALGDIDGDGFDDVAASSGQETFGNGYTRVYRGGASGFHATELLAGLESGGPDKSVQGVGDVDGDGFADVWAHWEDCPGASSEDPCLFRGSASGLDGGVGVSGHLDYNDHLYPPGDFDGDGLGDVPKGWGAAFNDWPIPDGTYGCTIYLGTGELWSRPAYTDDNDALCWSASLQGDLNGDGYDDLVAGAPGDYGGTSSVRVYHGAVDADELNDAWFYAESGEHYLGWSLAVADIDADGFADVVAGMPDEVGELFLLRGGAGELEEAWSASGPAGFGTSVALADFDADGDPDLAVGTPGDTDTITVYANDGGFDLPTQEIQGPSGAETYGWWAEDAGDVNGDGAHDLLVADPAASRVYVYAGDGPDADGDGVGDPVDCAPDDAEVAPGAEERCNERDDDCDGALDEDATDASTWFVDADGDGYGSEATTTACAAPDGYTATPGDCDDASASVFPGAAEVLDDGIDQDCDDSDSVSPTPEPRPTPEPEEPTGCTAGGSPGWGAMLAAVAAVLSVRRRSGAGTAEAAGR